MSGSTRSRYIGQKNPVILTVLLLTFCLAVHNIMVFFTMTELHPRVNMDQSARIEISDTAQYEEPISISPEKILLQNRVPSKMISSENSTTSLSTTRMTTPETSLKIEEESSSPLKMSEDLEFHKQRTAKEIATPPPYEAMSPEWKLLHEGGMTKEGIDRLRHGLGFHIIQIGAHTGFEENDPLSNGIKYILDQAETEGQRKNIHWTFVEPSPPSFKRLEENLAKNDNLCDLNAINAGVVPDTLNDDSKKRLRFYSFRDTIDPETGFDSISGKTLPKWITQISSFRIEPLLSNRHILQQEGLTLQDYIVSKMVATKGYSELVQEIMGDDGDRRPFVVLIDTEGFDCKIVNGLSPSSPFLPKYLVFEMKQCHRYQASLDHLKEMGYKTWTTRENAVAIMKNATQ